MCRRDAGKPWKQRKPDKRLGESLGPSCHSVQAVSVSYGESFDMLVDLHMLMSFERKQHKRHGSIEVINWNVDTETRLWLCQRKPLSGCGRASENDRAKP